MKSNTRYLCVGHDAVERYPHLKRLISPTDNTEIERIGPNMMFYAVREDHPNIYFILAMVPEAGWIHYGSEPASIVKKEQQ